jgi:hypothetical protein
MGMGMATVITIIIMYHVEVDMDHPYGGVSVLVYS